MASPGSSFPAAEAEKELNPALNNDFQVDPVSAQVTTSKQMKEEYEAAERKEEEEKKKEEAKKKEEEKDKAVQNFKTAVIVSGIIVAVAGAVFAITKKLREK
ncbi:hypothetical protein ACP275_10G088500 [Erythranthe tilingii]